MKLRTRIIVTFTIVVILPIILTSVAYFIIGSYLFKANKVSSGFDQLGYIFMKDSISSFSKLTENIYDELEAKAIVNDSELEELSYLTEINSRLVEKSSYLIVKKGDNIYYCGDIHSDTFKGKHDDNHITNRLPKYDEVKHYASSGYYYDDIPMLVKYIQYEFVDGEHGAIYIATSINGFVSKKLLFNLMAIIIAILLLVSYILTRWIKKGVFVPIEELSVAMQSIADGDYDYELSTPMKSELGDLYINYEEMRIRLKESTEDRLNSDRNNRELISNISHDLKTPITAIKGYVEGIMDGVADNPEKMNKYVKTIYNKANDMNRLINELTIYSKIDSNKIPYNFIKLNVYNYFNDCIEEIGLDLENKGIKLNYINIVNKDIVIIADPEQLRRVINNIVGNSVKYMDKEIGLIDFRVLDRDDSIRIEIEDNAKGIAEKDLNKIFERFYRTDASRNSAQGGSGIGLSIVKKIVEDHGGYIWATSKEGSGTCIHFMIRKYKEKKNE